MMDSWRSIRSYILWVEGLSHPSHFNPETFKRFAKGLVRMMGMIPVDNPILRHCDNLPLPDGEICSGLHLYQLWKTSGLSIFSWEVGRIEIMVHSCREFDHHDVLDYLVETFELQDFDWHVIGTDTISETQRSETYRGGSE